MSLTLLLFGVTLFVHSARGQEKLIERVRVQNEETRTLLDNAERLKEKGYLHQAVKTYFTLLKDHKNSVVRQSQHLYNGVPTVVRERVASWSEEEQSVFRELIRGKAASLLQKAQKNRSTKLFKDVALTYFITDAAESAAEELARNAFKEGHISSAVYWWKHLLKFHSEDGNVNDIWQRIAYALQINSDKTQFKQLRENVKQYVDQPPINVPPSQQTPSRNKQPFNQFTYNWPRPGGNRTGTGRVPSHLETYAPNEDSDLNSLFVHLWHFPALDSDSNGLFIPDAKETGSETSQDTPSSSQSSDVFNLSSDPQTNYRYAPILPIVYDDQLYINDSSTVFAFDLKRLFTSDRSPKRHLKWTFPTDRQQINEDAVKNLYSSSHGPISLEAYDGHLYFHRHQANTLHRIKARTGKAVFQTRAPMIDGDRLQFNGTPIVNEEGVFVPLIQRLRNDMDIYLGCYNRQNGELNWLRYIGSSLNTSRFQRDQLPNIRRFTHLLSYGNQVILSTHKGLISSVNAVTGEIDWIHNYSPYGLQEQEKPQWKPVKNSLRGLKPPRIIDNRLYVLPRDNPYFLGVNLKSGELKLKYRIPDAIQFLDHGTVNIIEKGLTAFFVKKTKQRYSLSVLSLSENSPKEMEVNKSFSQPPSVSPGKQRIILGRKKTIWAINRKNAYLKFSRKWPGGSTLPSHEMIATGSRIILVGPTGISVFTTLDQFVQKLGIELAKQSSFSFSLISDHP